MEFNDNSQALFSEPNAYIQHFDKPKEKCEPKKVIFQEPYENAPEFFIDNNFKKGDCHCANPKPKPCETRRPFFDFKNLLPLLCGLLKNNKTFSPLISILSDNKDGNFDPQKLISTLMQNPSALNGIMSMLKGGGFNLFKKKDEKPQMKSTEFPIKDYERVD